MLVNVEKIGELEFHTGHPSALTRDYWTEIQDLREKYYTEVYGHDGTAIAWATTLAGWNNPNISARATQARRFPEAVVALHHRDGAVGLGYVADDVSSRKTGVIGSAGRLAKIHLDRFIDHKYAWVREIIAPDDFVADAIMKRLMANRNPVQPTTLYPWQGETDLLSRAERWGYSMTDDFDDAIVAPGISIPQARMQTTVRGVQQAVTQNN